MNMYTQILKNTCVCIHNRMLVWFTEKSLVTKTTPLIYIFQSSQVPSLKDQKKKSKNK